MQELDLTLTHAKNFHEDVLQLAEMNQLSPSVILAAYLMGIRAIHHLLTPEKATGFREQLKRFIYSLEATKPNPDTLTQLGLS